jgi:hypothetical protein
MAFTSLWPTQQVHFLSLLLTSHSVLTSLLFSASLDDCDVPLPSLSDVDEEAPLSAADTASLESFIGMCRLTVILECVLL